MRKAVLLHSETRAYYRGHIPSLSRMRAYPDWRHLAYRAVPRNEGGSGGGSWLLVREPGAESASDREIELMEISCAQHSR